MGLDGKIYRLNAEELLAQALEHEIDHLNGIIYIDHLVDRDSLYKINRSSNVDEELEDDEESDEDESDEVVAPVTVETSASGGEA